MTDYLPWIMLACSVLGAALAFVKNYKSVGVISALQSSLEHVSVGLAAQGLPVEAKNVSETVQRSLDTISPGAKKLNDTVFAKTKAGMLRDGIDAAALIAEAFRVRR